MYEGKFTFTTRIQPSDSHDLKFRFGRPFVELGTIEFYAGSYLSIIGSNDVLSYAGETLDIELLKTDLPIELFSGETVSIEIQKVAIISQTISTGDAAYLDLDTKPSTALELKPIHDGHNFSLLLETNKLFASQILAGENLLLNFTSFPVVLLGDVLAYQGEFLSLDKLDVPKSVSFSDVSIYAGQTQSVTLYVENKLELGVFAGENVLSSMITSSNLDFAIQDGLFCSLQLSIDKEKGFEANIYSGASVVVSEMNFDGQALKPNIFAGESIAKFELNMLKPMPMPGIEGFEGSVVESLDFHYTFRTLDSRFYSGERASASLIIDYGELIYGQAGEQAVAKISTEASIGFDVVHGGTLEVVVDVSPPPVLSVDMYHGENVWCTMKHLYSPAFYPYPITSDSWLDLSLEPATTHFNLCTSCQMPIIHNNFDIRLERYEDIRMGYSANIGTRTIVDLSTAPRPQLRLYSGATMFVSLENTIDIGFHNIQTGAAVSGFELMIDKNIDTDESNPIVDGGHADVELGTDEPELDKYLILRDGSELKSDLATIQGIRINYPSGARISDFELVIDKWEFKIQHGQTLNFELSTTVRLESNISDGAVIFKPEFYETPLLVFDGATMEVSMKFVYDVEFSEQGCLDNEKKYFDEDGAYDDLRTTVAAVEYKPFQHSLKGKCF